MVSHTPVEVEALADTQSAGAWVDVTRQDIPEGQRTMALQADDLGLGEDIPEGLETTTLYTLAQLSFVQERYQDALDYMETWIGKAKNQSGDERRTAND